MILSGVILKLWHYMARIRSFVRALIAPAAGNTGSVTWAITSKALLEVQVGSRCYQGFLVLPPNLKGVVLRYRLRY